MKHNAKVRIVASMNLLLYASCGFGYDPTSQYEETELRGWTLLVNEELAIDHPILSEQVLDLLGAKLLDITRMVSEQSVRELKEIPIWVEYFQPMHPCACYHPSRQWLIEHDFNPQKAGSVEISNATNFITWTKDQPWMVLHELAHGYHNLFLGDDHEGIRSAFRKATEKGCYESVLRYNGNLEKHYALNNPKEYFAEATEAYFGTNDFYPFVRAELKEFDPDMYGVIEKVWGVKGETDEKVSGEPISTTK